MVKLEEVVGDTSTHVHIHVAMQILNCSIV